MSRFYQMELRVQGLSTVEKNLVRKVFSHLWEDPDSEYDDDEECYFSANSNLCGGKSDADFAKQLTEAVWKELARFVHVQVISTYLESLPTETFESDEDAYKKWKGR